MKIGIDFDNTIVCYYGVFKKVAVERSLVPENLPAAKSQVRDYLRNQGQENAWIELQGHVYGARMLDAVPCNGVLFFLNVCKELDINVCVISHRTLLPFLGPPYNLHQAARDWLRYYGFYEETGLSPDQVHFELTKQEKLNRIENEGCDLFIDDLPEFLAEPGFPVNVRRIFYDHDNHYPTESRFERATSWKEIEKLITENEKSD